MKYLIFRNDRVGDFLITAPLIKSIKRNNPDSHISIVSSSEKTGFRFKTKKKNVKKINLFKYDKLIIAKFLLDKFCWSGKLNSIK